MIFINLMSDAMITFKNKKKLFRFKTILLFIHKAVTLCAIGSSVDDEPPDTVGSASEAKFTGVGVTGHVLGLSPSGDILVDRIRERTLTPVSMLMDDSCL